MAHVGGVPAWVLGLSVAVVACNRTEAPPADPSPEPVAKSEPGPAVPAAAARFQEPTWSLEISPLGDYVSGKKAVAEIRLEAKGGYHTNDKYPYKWKAAESPGVRYAAPVVGKDAVVLEPSRATLQVEFTPESPGEKTIRGQFSFSVCSEDRCLIEKRDMALRIAAK